MEGSQSSESDHAGTIKHRPKAKKGATQVSDKNQDVPHQSQDGTNNITEILDPTSNVEADAAGPENFRREKMEQVRNASQREEMCYAGVQRRYRDSLDVEAAGLNQRYRDSLNLGGLDDSLPDVNALAYQDQAKPTLKPGENEIYALRCLFKLH